MTVAEPTSSLQGSTDLSSNYFPNMGQLAGHGGVARRGFGHPPSPQCLPPFAGGIDTTHNDIAAQRRSGVVRAQPEVTSTRPGRDHSFMARRRRQVPNGLTPPATPDGKVQSTCGFRAFTRQMIMACDGHCHVITAGGADMGISLRESQAMTDRAHGHAGRSSRTPGPARPRRPKEHGLRQKGSWSRISGSAGNCHQ